MAKHKKPYVISFSNRKGGCGKSTTCVNMAAALAEQQKNVLVIDLDPQTDATKGLHKGLRKFFLSSRDFLAGTYQGKDVAFKDVALERSTNLKIIPGSDLLNEFEENLVIYAHETKKNPIVILRERIQEIEEPFDFILIDCPPAIGALTKNALVASNAVLIPGMADTLSFDGAKRVLRVINDMIRPLNKDILVLGYVLTSFSARGVYDKELLSLIESDHPELLMRTQIRQDKKLREAFAMGMSIWEYKRYSNGALDYEKLLFEVLVKIQNGGAHHG